MTMRRTTSRLPLLAVLLPSAAVANAIDASKTQHLELPDGLVGPESVAFDARGAGPYVSISDGRVLKYTGEGGAGWTTFAYSPSYTKNGCDAQSSELPAVATESSDPVAGRWAFGSTTTPATSTSPTHTWG